MKKAGIIFCGLILIIAMSMGCNKDGNKQTIDFRDKSLETVQQYTTGKWKLAHATGGIAGITYQGVRNQYMLLTTTRIRFGDDSLGVFLDAPVQWTIFSNGAAGNFYMVTNPDYAIHKIMSAIRNDTLIVFDNMSDGFTYYYTKMQ